MVSGLSLRLSLSLRQKLFLVSLLILLIPWLGVRYVKAIEDYLQHIILDNLSSYTQSVATALTTQVEKIPDFPSGDSLYASPLRTRPQLDGYDADWGNYGSKVVYLKSTGAVANSNTPWVTIGRFEESIYVFISFRDEHIRYHKHSLPLNGKDSADAVIVAHQGDEIEQQLLITTEAPGVVYGRDLKTGNRETRVQGVWRERENSVGYQVELKLPVDYVSHGLNIRVRNTGTDSPSTFQIGSDLLAVLSTPDELRDTIAQFGLVKGRRLWLLDKEGRMLASKGSLAVENNLNPVNPLFAWLLTPDAIEDPWRGKTKLLRDDIQSALSGVAQSKRTGIEGGRSMLLSSAWPIHDPEDKSKIRAVVLIEESTAALQVLQRSALASMLNISLMIFLILTIALIGFAGRLSGRIRRLKKLTDEAIDEQGRVNGLLPELRKGDELDDLSNHVREMLVRLRAYHDYLEKLASRLSHEIRTPVAVVRSSLENMQLSESDNKENLERANLGIQRLQTLLHRMAEATRLEQSIHESEREVINIASFMNRIIQGYRDIYPSHAFDLECTQGELNISTDLLAQAFDKLVANAVSFAPENTVIKVSVSHDTYWRLSVHNQGSSLPPGMEQQLFQSMVSVRDKEHKDGQPHLGLGLHIVQLIAEFHGGSASAENKDDGVLFSILIPSE